jgi:4-hydroxy-tetrahydrodipicolinate synthase
MKELTGTGVALVTPFQDNGSLDLPALSSLVDHLVDSGIDYLVVLGTTAESAVLSDREKDEVIAAVVGSNRGRLPLVLGIGGNNTAAVVKELQTRDLQAFSAVLSVSPYYNRPTQQGIYQHFSQVAKASALPVILYNVPSRTASNMEPETVSRLARDHQNIVALKEAAGSITQAMRMVRETPEGFMVISGDDMITLPMVLAGGAGVISVVAQGFPREFVQMVKLGMEGKVKEAYGLHYQLMPAFDMLFEQGNPAGIKALLAAQGRMSDRLRLPLVSVDEDLRTRIRSLLN